MTIEDRYNRVVSGLGGELRQVVEDYIKYRLEAAAQERSNKSAEEALVYINKAKKVLKGSVQ